MAELGLTGELAMNMPMIARLNTHRWNGLVLGLVIVVMAHLTAATNAGRLDEPWPALLSSESASMDPAAGTRDIWQVDLTGRNERRLPTPVGASDPAWGPVLP